MNKKELVCIVCPLGCNVEVSKNDKEFKVSGNKCPRGKEYVVKELTNPTRIIPTTVKINNAKLSRLPVKTSQPVPKKDIFKIMKLINKTEVNAPVKLGDVVISNVLDLDVDIVATRSI